MRTVLLVALSLTILGVGVSALAPIASAGPPVPNVCLSYWYCIPHCLTHPDGYCDCKPECAPE